MQSKCVSNVLQQLTIAPLHQPLDKFNAPINVHIISHRTNELINAQRPSLIFTVWQKNWRLISLTVK